MEEQLKNLHKQYRELNQQLKHVSPNDKRAPISINNHISVVNFQISLLHRMILTLEVNENHNINRLITGSALVANNVTASQEPSARSFFENLAAYHSQEEIRVDLIAKQIKNSNFCFSELKKQQSDLQLEQNADNVDQCLKLDEEMDMTQKNLEFLKFNLIRQSRICNRLNGLFDFLRQKGLSEKERSIFVLAPAHIHSITPMNPGIGTLAQPMGLAFDTTGNLFYVD